MADAANLSLDAFIKSKKIKPFKKNAKVVKTAKGTKATVKRLGKNRPLKTKTAGNANKKISDARNKIILNKRQKIGDARERLGELARQGDARDRLNKLKGKPGIKETRIGNRMASRIGAQGTANKLAQKKAAQIKKQLGVQTGKNFKQNVTGQGKNLTRTVAGVAGKAAKGGATGIKTQRNKIIPAVNRQNAQRNQTTVTIKNNIKNNRAKMNQQSMRPVKQIQNARVQRAPYRPMRPQGMRSDMVWETYPQQPVVYQERVYPQEQYYSPQPVIMAAPRRMQMAPQYRETVYVDEYDAPIRQRPVYVEAPRNRPAPVRVKKPQQMSSNLAARLDQKQQQQPRKQHKVLVTNLHPCVSGEDMEELFSTIGTIVNARMVREGVAEATFLKEEDALRSVEVFHNRQLDGLPMNVTIIGKKGNNQRNNQRGPQPKSVLKSARGRTGYYV